jgi:hypothetical protein
VTYFQLSLWSPPFRLPLRNTVGTKCLICVLRHWVKLRTSVERYKVPKRLNQGLRVPNGLWHGFLSIIVCDCLVWMYVWDCLVWMYVWDCLVWMYVCDYLGFDMLPLLGSHLAKGGYPPNY